MGFFRKIKKFFFPVKKVEYEPLGHNAHKKGKRERRRIKPDSKREEYMSEKPRDKNEEYLDEKFGSFGYNGELMSPELISSFREFSQLLHNINIKMTSQNDQNLALLRSLEHLPAIIKDIPRARELEGDVLQEVLFLLKDSRTEKVELVERLLDIKTAMMTMEENAKAQISFFEGKERGHRDQMNMMREFMERERKHHRNNLIAIVFIISLFIAMLCAGGFLFVREKFGSLKSEFLSNLFEVQKSSTIREGRKANSPVYRPNDEMPVYETFNYTSSRLKSDQNKIKENTNKRNDVLTKEQNDEENVSINDSDKGESKPRKETIPFE